MTSQMTTTTNILIADANPATREALSSTFAGTPGMVPLPVGSASLASAIAMGREARIDLIVIGTNLPDEPGHDFIARLRRQGVRLPILAAMTNPAEQDIVAALDAGANDVIALPHRPAETMARIRAHLRCHAWGDDVVLPIGPYQFRPAVRLLQETETSRRIRLTDKETAVLKFLYRSAGVPVGRRALLREVWGYAPGATTHTVETHIYRLRRKIEPDQNEIRLLLNDGGGYRLASTWQRPATRSRAPSLMMEIAAE